MHSTPSAPVLEIQALVGVALFTNTDGSFNTGVGAGALILNDGGVQYRSWHCSVVAQYHGHREHSGWS